MRDGIDLLSQYESAVVKSARGFILASLAMIAFASNSLLCRAALKHTSIDAATFTLIRIVSGAVALWIAAQMRSSVKLPRRMSGDWLSAFALFIYAAGFSFAYKILAAGTGALLLFSAVQATMILWGIQHGECLRKPQLIGLGLGITGLVVLLFPGLSAPSFSGSILMSAAGVAWGIYSLRGRKETDAASATAGNFARAVVCAAVLSLIMLPSMRFDWNGTSYAVVSGALTSGLGYVIWYSALPYFKASSAAIIQLSVPVLAVAGGILLLGEPMTPRYLVASISILGGIALLLMRNSELS